MTIIDRYKNTFLWLQRYDAGITAEPEGQSGGTLPSPDTARNTLARLKASLLARGEASDVFAQEQTNELVVILDNLQQNVFDEAAYPTIESKAAHLLYFIVKRHPFTEGNNAAAALLFVEFLQQNQRLFNKEGQPYISEPGLTALTLLLAESRPCQKSTLIYLIMHMLADEHRN